jgi:hypothetical protein
MHVLDVSDSMNDGFVSDPTQVKLTRAKQGLIDFNNVVSPTLGDRVGLTVFPVTQPASPAYKWKEWSASKKKCVNSSGTWPTLYFGQKRLDLTSNILAVNQEINNVTTNAATPLAGGLAVATQRLLDPAYHNSSHVPVLIVASDGLPNVTYPDGKLTGYRGYSVSEPDNCNGQAVADAIAQANIAKGDANGDGKPDVVIFSIAIKGDNFNTAPLQAIASEPTSLHTFEASDAATMANIYAQIATRVQNIGQECIFNQKEQYVPYTTVTIRNLDPRYPGTKTTTTTSTGFFQFTDVNPGKWEFQSMSVVVDGLNYHIFTDGIGGPDFTGLPTVDVPEGAGTYEANLYLRTDDPVCGGVANPTATPPPPAATLVPTNTPIPEATPTNTVTPTKTNTPGPSPTPSNTPTATRTPTTGPSPTPTLTNTPRPTPTVGPSPTPTKTKTPSKTPTKTNTPGPSPTPTKTKTPTPTPKFGYNQPVSPVTGIALAFPATGRQEPQAKLGVASVTASSIVSSQSGDSLTRRNTWHAPRLI